MACGMYAERLLHGKNSCLYPPRSRFHRRLDYLTYHFRLISQTISPPLETSVTWHRRTCEQCSSRSASATALSYLELYCQLISQWNHIIQISGKCSSALRSYCSAVQADLEANCPHIAVNQAMQELTLEVFALCGFISLSDLSCMRQGKT